MRRAGWIIAGAVALVAVGWGLPSLFVQYQLGRALRPRVQASGGMSVRALTSALALAAGRVHRAEVWASGVRMGELTAQTLRIRVDDLRVRRAPDGSVVVVGARSGWAELQVGREDLEAFLRERGVVNPAVTIAPSGVEASGGVRAGPIAVMMRLRGQFYVVDRVDLHFRVDGLEAGEVPVPGPLVTTVLQATTGPLISFRRLPVAVAIEQVSSAHGRIVITARVAGVP
jgi:hypothetical protein